MRCFFIVAVSVLKSETRHRSSSSLQCKDAQRWHWKAAAAFTSHPRGWLQAALTCICSVLREKPYVTTVELWSPRAQLWHALLSSQGWGVLPPFFRHLRALGWSLLCSTHKVRRELCECLWAGLEISCLRCVAAGMACVCSEKAGIKALNSLLLPMM